MGKVMDSQIRTHNRQLLMAESGGRSLDGAEMKLHMRHIHDPRKVYPCTLVENRPSWCQQGFAVFGLESRSRSVFSTVGTFRKKVSTIQRQPWEPLHKPGCYWELPKRSHGLKGTVGSLRLARSIRSKIGHHWDSSPKTANRCLPSVADYPRGYQGKLFQGRESASCGASFQRHLGSAHHSATMGHL